MQHDHVLVKMNFDLLTPSPGPGGGGEVEAPNRGSGGKNCNQVANFVIIDAFFRKKRVN